MQLQARFGSLINIEAIVWFRIRVTVISRERSVYVNKKGLDFPTGEC